MSNLSTVLYAALALSWTLSWTTVDPSYSFAASSSSNPGFDSKTYPTALPQKHRSHLRSTASTSTSSSSTTSSTQPSSAFQQQELTSETEADSSLRVYDDGQTRVISPALDISTQIRNQKTQFKFGAASDIISSASSDVRSFASQGEKSQIHELRKEFSAGIRQELKESSLSLGYIRSDEKDYASQIFSASGTREFFQKNTVIEMGFNNGQDLIRSSANPNFKQPLHFQTFSFSWTQILSSISLLQLISDLRVENGYLASPYRKVKVISGNSIITLPENHPRTRNRYAFGARYNYFWEFPKIALSSAYRFYFDNWKVQSHTLEERISRAFTSHLSLSLTFRYYRQSKAVFFRDYYDQDHGPFYTGNKTLSSLDTLWLGVRPEYKFNANTLLYAKYEIFRESFRDAVDAHNWTTRADDTKLNIDAKVFGLGFSHHF